LNLTKEVRKLADYIVTKIADIPSLTGRSPSSLAAAAIYTAAELTGNGNKRTAEEIGRTCGAAENTIKQTLKLMAPFQSKLLPPDFKPVSSASTSSSFSTNISKA
jgi:transcription initiation factor TFIIB